ncbi:hypothetical protein BHM03_00019233 [Ensete ventricosum]|nr:hypothetical protein BHM03_00019233 [Ensete ventricosum]
MNPNPMTHLEMRDKRNYCHFHYDYEHDIEECHDLKNQIEDLIHQGYLDCYVREPHQASNDPSPQPKGPIEKQIDIIGGRLTSGGDSSSAQKVYAQAMAEKRLRHQPNPKIIFKHFTISKVLQSDNTQADALAWLASVRGSKKEPRMAKLFKPTISTPEVATTEVEYGWINEILYYKKDDSLPKDKATT